MTDNPEQWQQSSRLRAGDADRQRAIETLTGAWRAGRISREEFQERNQQLFTATYTDELEALTADIGGLSAAFGPASSGPAGYPAATLVPNADNQSVRDSWQSDADANLPVRYATDDSNGSALSVGVMSGMEKLGQWTIAPTHVSIGFWGGTTLDLRDAVFISPQTTITCIAVMGGIEVIVPPEMEVQVTGVGIMGGFGWEKIDQARPRRAPHPDAPVVTINGVGFWGGVEVYRRERGEPLH